MGMTVTAVYLFLAVVLVPALVKVGLDPLACHLYVLYWGTLSYITPPVALGTIASSAIAGSPPMRTGFLAMKLGIGSFLMPVMFVVGPALLIVGSKAGDVFLPAMTAIVGSVFIACGLEGFLYFFGKISLFLRSLSLAAGLCLLYPRWQADVAGLVLLIVLLVIALLQRKPISLQEQTR